MLKIIIFLLWGQPAQGYRIDYPISHRTVYPNSVVSEKPPFNEWIQYIHKLASY